MRILFFFICLYSINLYAQKEDHQWIFNWSSIDDCMSLEMYSDLCGASVLDFNTLPPTVVKNYDITLDFDKTHASICDENGELLFYCNGQSIHEGPQHEPLTGAVRINYSPKWNWLTFENENGEVKPSGFRRIDNAGIIPIPERKDSFLMLYQNYENFQSGNLNSYNELWSGIIQRDDTGAYELIRKDSIINKQLRTNGSLTACKHGNGRDWWMLQFTKDTVFTYRIDPNGINLDHIQVLPFELRVSTGTSKFNLTGNIFARHAVYRLGQEDGAELFISGFDRCTGTLIDPKLNKSSSEFIVLDAGLEFSPNSELLYTTDKQHIYQYDLMSEDVFASRVLIEERGVDSCALEIVSFIRNGWGQMQLGPDHKIYLANAEQCIDMHRINHPNKRGIDCGLERKAITLPTYHVGTVPTFNTYRLGPLDGSPCDTLGLNNEVASRFWYSPDTLEDRQIQFYDVSYYEPETWSWDFGDGNASNEISPFHEYEKDGQYTVCLTVTNAYSEDTSCDTLRLGVLSLTETPDFEPDINIFPNPVEDYTRVVMSDYIPKQGIIDLYDSKGLKAFQSPLHQETKLNLSHLSSGLYVYKIRDGKRVLTTGKILKI